VALFTDDAVMSGSMGSAHGRDALRDAVARIWAGEPPDTLHLATNVVIDDASFEPSVASVMLMVAFRSPPDLVGVAHVRQTTRRTTAGWRISSRTITTPTAEAS
jgi:predicted Zn-dependent protease with MMP-like domain